MIFNNFDTTVDESEYIDEELICVHIYDEKTYEHMATSYLESLDDIVDEHYTLTALPEHDDRTSYLIYNKTKDSWIVKNYGSPLADFKELTKRVLNKEIKNKISEKFTSTAVTFGIYDLKYQESIAFLDKDTSDDYKDYPFIKNGVDSTQKTPKEYANIIISKNNEYKNLIQSLDIIKLKYFKEIDGLVYDSTKSVDEQIKNLENIAEQAISAIEKT